MTAALLPPDLVAMMARGVSVNVASRDAAMRPSLMRAVGSSVEQDGRWITVFVSRSQSRQLVQDLAATGCIAVVFSEPATHRTVQLKATHVELRHATAQDEPALAAYLTSMEVELGRIGYPPAIPRAMLSHRLQDVVAISFEPQQAFNQTPGPRAGTPLAGEGAP